MLAVLKSGYRSYGCVLVVRSGKRIRLIESNALGGSGIVCGFTFNLVRKCAGKQILRWWRCGARRGREFETASSAKAYDPRTRLRL